MRNPPTKVNSPNNIWVVMIRVKQMHLQERFRTRKFDSIWAFDLMMASNPGVIRTSSGNLHRPVVN